MNGFRFGLFLGVAGFLLAGAAGAAPGRSKNRAGRVPGRSAPSPHAGKAPAQADAIMGEVVDRLWARGDWYWHEGRYEERVALDRLVIRMDPQFIEPYGTAGWLLESLGRDQEALALYRQAVAAAPQRWEPHHDLGMYYYQHKQYPAAAAEFRRGTQQAAAPVYVWKMLGHALERSGSLDQAVTAWEAASRIAPDDPAVGVNLQRLRARLNTETKPEN